MMGISFPKPKWWLPSVVPLTFFLTGLLFLPYPGIQNDEALFASPLYRTESAISHFRILNHEIPVMLMTYLGALKTWIYVPIFRVARPSAVSIRLPALLIGAAAIWVLFLLLRRIHGETAALIGTVLLGTDSMFLLTSCFDWGPVALQHLLGLLGLLALVHFHQEGRVIALFWAGLCFGLALWDKALFIWLLSGFFVATLIVFPRLLIRHLTLRNVASFGLAFVLGALPLITYNLANQFPTFHSTSGFSFNELYTKSMVLRGTWEGATLSGYLTNLDLMDHPRLPSDAIERAAFWLRSAVGERHRNQMNWAIIGALACLPFLWRRPVWRPVLFCAITLLVAWLQMAITRTAGGAAHHVVLLWPLPHMIIAVVFSEMALLGRNWGRTVVLCVTLWFAATNLLLTNQYLYEFARNGSPGSWTDAIYPLSDGLKASNATQMAIIDWGMVDSLDLLNRGRLPLYWAADFFLPRPAGEKAPYPPPVLLDDPQVLWVGHTDGQEQFAGGNAGVDAFCVREGFRKSPVGTYYDRNGRAVFQTFRLIRNR